MDSFYCRCSQRLPCAVYWGMEGFVLTENTGLCHHMAVLIPTEAASHRNFGGCALMYGQLMLFLEQGLPLACAYTMLSKFSLDRVSAAASA